MVVDRIVPTMSAAAQDFRNVLRVLSSRQWALGLVLAAGCCSRTALYTGEKDAGISGDATGSGGLTGMGGEPGGGGISISGGVSLAGGGAGSGGANGSGGTRGSGGIGGTGGTTGSGGVFGMPCATNQDCPSNSTCCDGSDPSCDGTRLPAGDGTNAGELVASVDGLTVSDAITGLVWQRDGSGVRAGCSSDDKLTCTWDEAEAYCASLALGGLSGWRLPGWMELFTILNLAADWTGSTIDQTAFPNTPTEAYWTSSALGRSAAPMLVQFQGAAVSTDCGKLRYRVRCVRGARCYPTTRFLVLDGGLVRDTLTGLVWQQQGSTTAMTWADAQSYCSSVALGGFRMPTLKELDSLADPTLSAGQSIGSSAFPSTGTNRYWTASVPGPGAIPSDYAFLGDFSSIDSNTCDTGTGNTAKEGSKFMVRCVR